MIDLLLVREDQLDEDDEGDDEHDDLEAVHDTEPGQLDVAVDLVHGLLRVLMLRFNEVVVVLFHHLLLGVFFF